MRVELGGNHSFGKCESFCVPLLPNLTQHSLHINMFGSLLIVAASILFLVKNDSTEAAGLHTGFTDPETEQRHSTLLAVWSASTSLATVLLNMTSIALLNRPLDKPNTLVVNSRYI